MRKIKLTKGYKAIVDDEDFECLNQYKWFAQERHGSVYAHRCVNKTKKNPKRLMILMHREILKLTGSRPIVDHINRNGIDNRKENLRVCNHTDNIMNRTKIKRKCKSKYKGVRKSSAGKTWQASIWIKGKFKYLGTFKTQKDAAIAYNEAVIKYYDKHAFLNKV